MYEHYPEGGIEVICGSMYSGKTEELIKRVERARIAGHQVRSFKPTADTRTNEAQIGSHRQGLRTEAISVASAGELLALVEPTPSVIAVDEGQFFGEDFVAVCEKLAYSGKRVIVAGLDLDFRGEPFGHMPELMARADRLDKLHAICIICGALASRSQRILGGEPAPLDSPTIMVGDQYEARCRFHHVVPR